MAQFLHRNHRAKYRYAQNRVGLAVTKPEEITYCFDEQDLTSAEICALFPDVPGPAVREALVSGCRTSRNLMDFVAKRSVNKRKAHVARFKTREYRISSERRAHEAVLRSHHKQL